jgi:HlyD family secretion protein
MPENQLFRKAAIEKLASPERLDVLMQVTSPVGWVAIATVAFILGCAIVWSVVGSIPTRIDAQGILLRGGGLRELKASGEGVLTKVDLKLNDMVKSGQLVAEVSAGNTDDAVNAARQRSEQAQREYSMSKIEDESTISGLRNTILNYQSDLERTQSELTRSNEDLVVKREQLSKGLITKTRVDSIERDASNLQSKITSLRNQISGVNSQIRGVDQRIRQRQQAVDAAKLELDQTLHTVATVSKISATVEGRVVELKKNSGDRIRPGEVLAVLEPPSAMLEPVVFVNSTTGKRIKAGMEAQISPATVKREEYGFMKGTVRFVGDYPVTPDAAMSIIANQTLLQELIGTSAKLEMRAALKPSAQAASGYEWSSSSGPPFRVDTGTRVTVSVVVDRKRPISYILPILRSTLGST